MPGEQFSERWTPTKIALLYLLSGFLWILLSDRILLWMDGGTGTLTLLQTYKGWLYVATTGLLLYLLINRGIDELRRNELAKLEAAKRYSEIVENANDIIYVLDESGKFTSINPAGEQIIGYSKNEFLEKNLADIVAPEYQKYINRLLGRIAKKDRPVYEIEVIRKNGSQVLLEVSNRPIYRDGSLFGMQGIARDVTERRAMEEKLKQTKNRYSELIRTSNEGILITDEQGIITFVNQQMAEMLDYDQEEILDNYVFDFMDDEGRAKAEENLERRKKGIKEQFDFKLKKFGGSDLWVIVSATPLFEDGKYIGSLSTLMDITKRKLAEEELLNERRINNATIDSLPGIFYFYDNSGKFLRWNQNFETVSGYTAEEIAGMHPLDFFEGEEKVFLEERITEVFEKGESSAEAHFVSKDGSRKPFFFTGKRIVLDGEEYLLGVGIDVNTYKSVTGDVQAGYKPNKIPL
jgi:PAS domain S-box-containing protein